MLLLFPCAYKCVVRCAGLTKRLAESNVQLISSCNSAALRDLRLEAGRRHIAAVAADQLDHLGFMTQLTSLSLALSKGSLPAGKSAQQLLKLSGKACDFWLCQRQ
jgi:hypothetical protein